MTLKDNLNQDLKAALRAGDEMGKSTLRQLLAGVKQAELERRAAEAKKLSQDGELSAAQLRELEQFSLADPEVISVIQKEAKARRESIADAEKAGRADLVSANQAELALLESYLPQQLTRDELVALAKAAIAEAGAADLKQQGAVMKLLAPRTKGQADGKLVSDIVRELLGG